MSKQTSENTFYINKSNAVAAVACMMIVTGGAHNASLKLTEDTKESIRTITRSNKHETFFKELDEKAPKSEMFNTINSTSMRTVDINDIIKVSNKEKVMEMSITNYYAKTFRLINVVSAIILLLLLSLNFVAGNSLKGWIISLTSSLVLFTANKFTNEYLKKVKFNE